MFTGIVQGTGIIIQKDTYSGGCKLRIDLEGLDSDLQTGASVAVNGVCLTTVKTQEGWAEFELIQKTLTASNLGSLKLSDKVNLERACRFGDEVGGHQVTGHVDTVGTIQKINLSPNNRELEIHCDDEWMPYLIPNGWIAVDGVSLTVARVEEHFFSVCLIPETLDRTILGEKEVEGCVNLECDPVTKTVVHTVNRLLSKRL